MTVQPKFHWQFTANQGAKAVDSVSGATAELFHTQGGRHGRIGQAIRLDGRKHKPRVVFGNAPGRVGTSDFTVAFGMKVQGTYKQKVLHIIGNRTTSGHGNFFSLRMRNKGELIFEVDENSKGKNYAVLNSKRPLKDAKWHHIAIVRQGRSLKLYIDGELSEESRSKTGIANITTKAAMSLGTRGRKTPVAEYEDIRIYHAALSAADVRDLVTPANRPLRAGEIELVATDNAAVVLKQDVADLARFSPRFQKVRLGADTGVTLYKGTQFSGVAQKLAADIPDMRLSRLGAFPRSIQLRSTVGEPFTGKRVIKAPNGEYLSQQGAALVTAPTRSLNELFDLREHPNRDRPELIPASNQALQVEGETVTLLIDDAESSEGAFAIVNPAGDQWLKLNQDNTFNWTQAHEDRAVFCRAAKMADHEEQVGELTPGEVALYENIAYWGRTWILSDSEPEIAGSYARLSSFHGLDDQISSIRVGPETGVTLFRHEDNAVTDGNREEEIEDIVENVPDLGESQVGNDAISSLQIFQTIAAEDVFASYTTKLSQDYRMVDNKLEEFSAYRTTLRFEPGAGAVEVAATDFTIIEVDGTTYTIDEARSVTLKPNELNFIMITSEADGLNTPGLKIRTSEMADNEQVVIFPNQEAHQQIAELEDGALWNAKDAQGNLIVDRTAHSQAEVASVQNTIKRVTATVTYTDEAPVANEGRDSQVLSSNRVVSGAAIDNPWELKFKPAPDESDRQQIPAQTAILKKRGLVSASVVASGPENGGVQEAALSQGEFTRLLSQATSSEAAPISEAPSKETQGPGAIGFGSVRRIGGLKRLRIGRRIRNAIKKATSVVVGAVKGVVHFVVKTAEEVIDFVVDTVEKVGEFIEAVVEKVVNGIKKFIEFLQFLFNWDDILDTQKYLVQSINDGFDYVAQQVEAVKAPVSNFIDELQETVEDAMNQLVTTLGGDPSEVRESGSGLPEAAEWFFSKLLGGSKQDDAEPTPQSVTPPSGDSKPEHFVFHFVEAFADGVGAVLRGFEGLGETIATLIANPLKPQLAVIVLVETLRDVVIQLLEAVENLALGFLDAIAEAIEQLKNLLNAEIKIPFISDLFRLIGGGKLTLLNLTGLLLAIPVTIVSKLIFGETPFKNEPPLALALQTDAQAIAAPQASLQTTSKALGETAIAQVVAEPRASFQRSNLARIKSIQHWGATGLLADAINGAITAYLDVLPESSDDPYEETAGFGFEIVSLVLSGYSWLASFPSSPGFPGGRPYNVAAHKVSKTKNEQEYWERVMWGWRTAVYWLDVVIFVGKEIAAAKGNDVTRQRLKRADKATIAIDFAFSIVDAGLAIRYLTTIPKGEKPGLEIANEVVSWLPNLLSPMRLAGPKGAAALSVVDGVAAFANYAMDHKLLTDDLAEL
ncbi:MAG: LamG-like jellyroll fold domain-containing protein [Cyanobacteria bacterium J06626_18]